LTFDALPGAVLEAQEVVAQWQRDEIPAPRSTSSAATLIQSSRLLLGAQATEGAFKRWAPHHRVLHIATHGFFLGEACVPPEAGSRGVGGLSGGAVGVSRWHSDPVVRSGLALAGANNQAPAGATEDGILMAEEVSGLDLEGTDWAVLSACDTGVGTVAIGEGVLGLRRAFQIAGVQTVIMSLWGADDEWSRHWMRALYAERLSNHLTTADAVRHASLSVLNERRREHLSSHPFFWAGFVAVGNWR
jgi:CHAT domain-containing protein